MLVPMPMPCQASKDVSAPFRQRNAWDAVTMQSEDGPSTFTWTISREFHAVLSLVEKKENHLDLAHQAAIHSVRVKRPIPLESSQSLVYQTQTRHPSQDPPKSRDRSSRSHCH